MPNMNEITADLAAEHAELDALLTGLDEGSWLSATPAAGWDVRDTVSHLAFFDEAATLAASDPAGFRAHREQALADLARWLDEPTDRGRALSGAQVLAWWRQARAGSLTAFARLDPKTRVPWYGVEMSAVSFATARLMETWAHGQDVADALGRRRTPTDRLYHVAFIGVRALPNSFRANGRPVPVAPVRVELTGPGGEQWSWGETGAADVVRGTALDFCLVVTQRRHVADTALEVDGPVAAEWISIAQAFAGPPGEGRRPGQFARES